MNPSSSLLYAALWVLGHLPWRIRRAFALWISHATRFRNTREAQVAEVNLRLSLPHVDADSREQLRRDCLYHTALTALETAAVWTQPAERSLRWVREVENGHLLDAAEAAGRGVIVAAPHIGNWELFSVYLASRRRIGVVYRPPERRVLEPLLIKVRSHPGIEPLRAEPNVVRRMLALLRVGGTLGILPDQRPKAGEGLRAPLFGVPALTMTLLPRLAQKTGAAVVFGFAERLPDSDGFRIRLLAPPNGLLDPDPVRSASALNAGIEACIALAPSQYQWTYKRYPARDADGVHRYIRSRPVPTPVERHMNHSTLVKEDATEFESLHGNARWPFRIAQCVLAIILWQPVLALSRFALADPLGTLPITSIALLGLALLLWWAWRLAERRFQAVRFRLDAEGLTICRGVYWQSETHIARSRVQHTDIQRGPLDRRLGLADLSIHTAGTSMATVRLSGLSLDRAQSLRDSLLEGHDQRF